MARSPRINFHDAEPETKPSKFIDLLTGDEIPADPTIVIEGRSVRLLKAE